MTVTSAAIAGSGGTCESTTGATAGDANATIDISTNCGISAMAETNDVSASNFPHGGNIDSGTGNAGDGSFGSGTCDVTSTGPAGDGSANAAAFVSASNGGSVLSGATGNGGYGGGGSASVSVSNSSSDGVSANVDCGGGNGGQGEGSGNSGGNGGGGGIAVGGVSASSSGGGDVLIIANVFGGNGGFGDTGATGGEGGSVLVNNAVTGSTSGSLNVEQSAYGGDGGGSNGGLPGGGGFATSSLTLSQNGVSSLTIQSLAEGGAGGSIENADDNAGQGEAAVAFGSGTTNNDVDVIARANNLTNGGGHLDNIFGVYTGDGGSIQSGTTVNGGNGASATATATADSTGTVSGSSAATAQSISFGGDGGSVGGGASGDGGNAASANSTSTASSSGPDAVSASANAVGGNGGSGAGAGNFSGTGGNASASATVNSSSTTSVSTASANATGGPSSAPTSSATVGAGGSASASATANGVTVLQNVNPGSNGAGGVAIATTTWSAAGGATVSVGVNNVNGGAVTVTGPSALIDGITGPGTLTVGNGSSPTLLKLFPSSGGSSESSLTIQTNSTLDIANNHFYIDYGTSSDPVSTIVGYLRSGFNNGNWNGTGIISADAQTPTKGLKYGVGWADGADGVVSGLSSGQIELKYTLLGDANLDGTVNGSDFSILAANFGKGVTNWDQGNFLYSSSVNGSDFSALAANFGQGDSGADVAVSSADVAALDAFAVANGLPLPTIGVVPEPASLATGVGLLLGLVARRKRRVSRR
jgi:hypothetical protein